MKITKKHGYFWITTGEGTMLTEGYRYCELVATRIPGQKYRGIKYGYGEPTHLWSITHLRTGYSLGPETNLQNIRGLIRHLNCTRIDWAKVTPENSRQYADEARKAIGSYNTDYL